MLVETLRCAELLDLTCSNATPAAHADAAATARGGPNALVVPEACHWRDGQAGGDRRRRRTGRLSSVRAQAQSAPEGMTVAETLRQSDVLEPSGTPSAVVRVVVLEEVEYSTQPGRLAARASSRAAGFIVWHSFWPRRADFRRRISRRDDSLPMSS